MEKAMSNRLQRPPADGSPQKARPMVKSAAKPVAPPAKMSWALSAIGLLFLLALTVAGFSVWVILHKH